MADYVAACYIEAGPEEDIEALERELLGRAIDEAYAVRSSVQVGSVAEAAIKLLKARLLRDDPHLPERIERAKADRDRARQHWESMVPNSRLFMKDHF
jgi:hypothetical protein